MPFVNARDARLYYETSGRAGTPVLLIMGFGVPGRFWANQVPALARRHKVAWFDNCGAGGGTVARRRRPFTMRHLADHAAHVLDALAWPRAHVVGVSMGGMIAQELALTHAERVRSLSLLVTHAGGMRNMLPTPRAVGLFVRGFLGPRRFRSRALERLVFSEGYLAKSGAHRERLTQALDEEIAGAAGVRERLGQLAAVFTHSTARRLAALERIPTLIVEAAADVLVAPRAVRRLHRLIPGSRLVALDAGHAVLHERAAELNRELLAHFASADR